MFFETKGPETLAGLKGQPWIGGSQEDIVDSTWAASAHLLSRRHDSVGLWLEADVAIPAEYILQIIFWEINDNLEAKLANYIRRVQSQEVVAALCGVILIPVLQ